ncbi:Dynein assembly factor 2 axonemal [Fasciola hepatica]|uniref:Protein kintoun n=1 Tax=Fasciola hepatica TaxID=6192 RepID=A0A4E0S1E8_FASHE|nr:Dynein assembly factor 2 axonemal [Fasciola hepatica]
MAQDVSSGLESLKLTNDELGKLKKAFGDPEFRRLFKEYAEEITDPENRKRYEEEIRTMEQEQGMEVEFINPTPGYCLKTRHWPSLLCADSLEKVTSSDFSPKNTKVFINVCKSDKVGCPIMKPIKNSSGKAVSNGFYWSLPHCFTPPHEDFDKNKQMVMVYDVAFHPKAFELANTSAAMRRLLNVTAVEGVQRQFSLCLGKTAQQALHLSQLIKSASEPFSRPVDPHSHEEPVPSLDTGRNRAETVAREEAILRVVHTLKGTTYKGMARPAVIRRRREDYEQCQAELKRRTEEELKNCADPAQRETLTKLSRLTQSNSAKNDPSIPSYTITYSSDFDLINCRDAPDVNPMRPPDRLRVSVKLPGLVSSNAVDLELTSTHLSLSSEKPVSYQLELKLPYEVDDSKGSAKFDKSSSTLLVTAPLKKKQDSGNCKITQPTSQPLVAPVPVEPVSTNDESQLSPGDSCVTRASQTKKRRRKKYRRRHSSAGETVNDNDTDSSASKELPSDPTSHQTPVKSIDLQEHIEAGTLQSENTSNPVLTAETLGKSSDIVPSVTPIESNSSIPVTHVGLQQLIVNKDRRLAPVRFRQDPSAVSILFSVRGILPNSFVLHWASPPLSTTTVTNSVLGEGTQPMDSATPEETLLLLFNFSSRGSGGCTMDWGVVIRCPSAPVKDSELDSCREKFHHNSPSPIAASSSIASDPSLDSIATVHSAHSEPPRVLSVAFGPTNAVVVLGKPLVRSDKSKNKDSCWWTSVATGRTLIAGMQECPFEGVDGCLSQTRSHFGTAPEPTDLGSKTNALASPMSQIHVCTLSTDCCEIAWSRSESTLVSKTIPGPIETNKTSSVETSCGNLRQKNKEYGIVPPPLLKGILKQRSFSESSGDEQFTPSGALRFAGLADTRADMCLSSDEFPTASSDEVDEFFPSSSSAYAGAPSTFHELRRRRCQLGEGMRRCMSNEKLVTFSSLSSEVDLPTSGRRRRRSVNFSTHDQHVDYSPRDTVEALHHTLVSRRKKARRRETRRRNYSGEMYTATSTGAPERKSGNRRGDVGRPTEHFSGNNSFGEDLFRKVVRDTSPDHTQTFDNAGDRPQPSDSSNSTTAPVAPDNTLSEAATNGLNGTVESNSEGEITSANTAMRSADPTTSPTKRTTSAVTLCATPLFELDEE